MKIEVSIDTLEENRRICERNGITFSIKGNTVKISMNEGTEYTTYVDFDDLKKLVRKLED